MARIVRASPISPIKIEIPAAIKRIIINTSINCRAKTSYHLAFLYFCNWFSPYFFNLFSASSDDRPFSGSVFKAFITSSTFNAAQSYLFSKFFFSAIISHL